MSSNQQRNSSSSYIKPEVQDDHPSDFGDDENTQLSLDPKLQMYLAQMSQESGCWGRFFPIPFERAAQKSWWDPTFDSEILEEQYKKSSHLHNKLKFRYALIYMSIVSLSWLTYFVISGVLGDKDNRYWPLLCTLLLLLVACLTASMLFTYTRVYRHHMISVSLSVTLLLTILSLSFLIVVHPPPVGHFSLCIQMLFLIYTLVPLKLYMSLTVGILYSIGFELLNYFLHSDTEYSISIDVTKLLCHIGIHLIGFHICLMSNVRMRNTFMKVGQSLLVRRQLELEKRLKENMIHSLMPKSVADWLKKEDENFTRRQSSDSTNDIRSLFRPFNMDHMENVSILFADIVGFTKMSSNKSAEELVDILNNLFQRFDLLCKFHNCEKISTLGDCYYCVSGCPEARADHALCCVEMGLSMIQAIKQFDQERKEGVNMRVGVHTGKVLCGIVGTRRFKFDVWSNDVTLANKMESTGKPGTVHVSEKTVNYLQDMYNLEEGECVFGLRTYFILGRKGDKTPSYSGSFRAEGRQKYANSLQLFVSPPSSNTSMSPHTRTRVQSCDTSSNYMKPQPQNQNLLSPDVCKIKASSLPSILDMENEDMCGNVKKHDQTFADDIKTPTSTASSGKYSGKLKNWKIPKFMRKSSDQRQELEVDVFTVSAEPSTDDGYQQVYTIFRFLQLSKPTQTARKKDSFVSVTKPEEEELIKDTLDIKSYISQSRSDIGQFDFSPNNEFIRTGSYRSQYGRSPIPDLPFLQRAGSNRSRRGRSPNFDGLEPTERARSATITATNIQRPKRSLEVPSRLSSVAMLEDYSNHSRKDSGIKSNSRRSSIIQIDNTLINPEMLQHRVSGYYTSSQTSINAPQVPRLTAPFFDKFGTCIQNLRKQSDRQLIKCVQDNSKSRFSYFIKPPLSKFTLFFKDDEMEKQYRMNVHYIGKRDPHTIPTLANSSFNTYLDVFVSSIVFLLVSVGTVLLYGITKFWLVTFALLSLLELLGLTLCFKTVVRWTDRIFWCFIRFYRWNLFGAVLVSLPLVSVVVNFVNDRDVTYFHLNVFTYLLFVGLVHFCNFTQLNCWMKNILATFVSLVFVIIFLGISCSISDTGLSDVNVEVLLPIVDNITTSNSTDTVKVNKSCYFNKAELLMNLSLLVILVWILTREFEIGYRLSFHANYVANRDKNKVQSLKNQADYLIYNIVPEHVAEQLKKNAKYSENFKNVAIIFASIVNFNEMYDESYEGGREYLRVLNELIGDFDELLDRFEFHSVEKIKTIGSTFMAASGLNSYMRQHQKDPNEHLYALLDFAMEMQRVVNDFNRDLLEFNLILRIGYNFGDVTAAVIGNTKLYYDIWGDAVNVASRMDSTGVSGRIQVGEYCLPVLESRYEFEPRGSVYVKGKDHMNVYLLKKKKTPDLLCVPDVSM
ncbi:hypothetical protein NQ315_003817 [Exocentrus adspersus]|uniref:Adenylate cyclase type 9 n=1 Tax=Exocentrus adspersus TaxID=1586481 RepID=A0AAV8VYE9_9CUCU|nr:hypothetical protein NQ315_003817 [Exocentrus adspersus]